MGRTSKLTPWVFVALVAILAPEGGAYACVADGECENGDTCSVPDACVGGTCVEGGGGDVAPADLVCDDELDPGIRLVILKLSIRRRTSSLADNSSVKAVGYLIGGSPTGAFTGIDGIAIRAKDGLSDEPSLPTDGIDTQFVWESRDCTESPTRIDCASPGGMAFAKFMQVRSNVAAWTFKFKIKPLGDPAGPFWAPARVVLTYAGSRHGSTMVSDCWVVGIGPRELRCRGI